MKGEGERKRLHRALKIAFFLLMLIFLAAPAAAAPDGAQQVGPPSQAPSPPPQGCPGGPAGPAVPGTECPDGSVPTPIPAGCPGSPLSGPPAAGTTCPDGTVIPAAPGDRDLIDIGPGDPTADDRLAEMFALDQTEEHPLSAYDIGCDEGSWNAFLRKMWCGAQALPFALGKWFIGIGTELLGWALEFRVAETLAPMAGLLSRVYSTSLIGPLDIADLAWTVALFVGGFHLMRARFADGAREILTTFLIAVVGSVVLANPQGYLEGSIALAQNTSGAVLEAVDGALHDTPAQDAEAVRERLGVVLRRSFVAEPYDLINWGESLSGECAAARDELLAEGPWGGDDRPREIMREHGCERQAAFNERPSDNRAVSSLTVAGASGLVTVLMVVLALAVFAAQLTLIVLFSGASMAWAIALFPGGRSILWWWISRLVWAVLITFTSIFLLSWIAITITVVLDNTTDISIVQRCLIAIMIVAVAFKFRSSVDRAIDGASAKLASSMGRMSKGSGQPSGAFVAGAVPAAGGGFQPMSWSPTRTLVAGAGAGAAAYGIAQKNAERARTVGGGAAAAARSTRRVGTSAVRGTRALAMAPVTIPERVGQARAARATQRSIDVRDKINGARAARAQWARNARHPLAAVRNARTEATQSAHDTTDWI